MNEITPPAQMDLEQYVAAEVLREQVEHKFLQYFVANRLLRTGLGLTFDYFREGKNGIIYPKVS